MKTRSLVWSIVLLVGGTTSLWADITFAPLFRDGAVLQRDQPLTVWGRAAAAEKVEVKFRRQSVSVITGADGRWRVTLKPERASIVPSELIATGANTVTVRDVLVGDVWLCSGQSNMAMLVRASKDADREMAAADFPLIRQFKLPNVVGEKPADDVAGSWVACAPMSAGSFSAVAYFFARDLHQKLGVPIGIVNSSWGGTPIESWMSEAGLKADPAAKEIFARAEARLAEQPAKMEAHGKALAKWESEQAAAKAAGREFKRAAPARPDASINRFLPAGLYNGMIAPLVPFTFKGILWYQGEANAARHAEYATLFSGMIKQWRSDFGQMLPFYFVQLANYESGAGNRGDTWAYLREAQARALELPQTAMAVTLDIGETKDIHPKNKQEVGRRLALQARGRLFGEKIETDGPMFAEAKPEGAAMRITFTHAAGLKLETEKSDGRVAFEVAGADKKFVPATAKVEGASVIVSAAGVQSPVAVRYAWRNSPDARLFNGAGLPAAPFRSDSW